MANFSIDWDNSQVNASSNALNQRVSKRISPDSNNPGATPTFSTAGFTPTNDMNKSVSHATTTGLANVLYEFKVEAICTTGGPTINNNGVRQEIVFECIPVTLIVNTSAPDSSLKASINTIGLDITKVRYILKDGITNAIISSQIINTNQIGLTTATFTGLTANHPYYASAEFYSIVNGVEVISTGTGYAIGACFSSTVSTETNGGA